MEMPLSGFTSQPVDDSLDHIMKASQKRDNLRFFTVDRVRSYDDEKEDCGGEWLVCSPQSAAEFSAVGYFFGNNIAEATDIPIGLIAADFGDTRVEAWMPLDALRRQQTRRDSRRNIPTIGASRVRCIAESSPR